jgi:L-threonate 2-dehydrogenase
MTDSTSGERPDAAAQNPRPSTATAVGVIGLGNLGLPYAEMLLRAGYRVIGFDVRAEALEALSAAGGVPAAGAAEVARMSGLVILSLPTLAAFVEVNDVLAEGVAPGQVIVDTSTMRVADKLAARDVLARAGALLIDAAVSTTPQALREGRLVLFASGDEEAFIAARPALETFSGTIHFVGEFGNASRIKLVCNLLVAIHNAATAEAMALVEASGLDAELTHRVVSDGVASSRIWERRGALMLDGDYREGSFAYRIATHDAPLIDELSREVGAFTPMFRLAEHLHHAAIAMGLERYDTASMLELYRACRTTRES